MSGNEFDGIEKRLREVEQSLTPVTHDDLHEVPAVAQGTVVGNEAELARLPGAIEPNRCT